MTIVRLTMIFAIVLSLGIASASASYQQPKRPSRAEAERAREIEKQKRDALAQARVDANTAARQIFEQYHTESCDEPGTWTRKGNLLNDYNKYTRTTYKPRYWFTQFRGLRPIAPHPNFGFNKPDAATAANYPDVDYVAEFYVRAEIGRHFYCSVKDAEGKLDPQFGGCLWTPWRNNAPVMSMTLWRRRGVWQLQSRIEFLNEYFIENRDGPSWLKPTCNEVSRGIDEALEEEVEFSNQAADSEKGADVDEQAAEAQGLIGENKGMIAGPLTYPSDRIPSDLVVCVEGEGRIACSDSQNKLGYVFIVNHVAAYYQVSLPAGNYYVYGRTSKDEHKAYWNEFVRCGISVNCHSTKKLEVVVTNGQVTRGIMIGDFWMR